MTLNLEKVRVYATNASNRELLDRVTVFKSGMEPNALTIIHQELRHRGVTQTQIQDHETLLEPLVIRGPEGMPRICKKCSLPAISCEWGWLKVFGFIPILPWKNLFCEDHKKP